MTREEAIKELRVIRTNVSRVLAGIHTDSSMLSRKWRDEKIDQLMHRIEVLTFAIDYLEATGNGEGSKQ